MEVTQSTVIKLSQGEYSNLTKLIHDLYDICDTDEYVGQVMNDIYNARAPKLDEKDYRYDGYVTTVIVTK